MYTIYINNTLLLALAAREIYRDIFGPPMVTVCDESTKQDETFFDVANLKNILTVFVFSSYNVF